MGKGSWDIIKKAHRTKIFSNMLSLRQGAYGGGEKERKNDLRRERGDLNWSQPRKKGKRRTVEVHLGNRADLPFVQGPKGINHEEKMGWDPHMSMVPNSVGEKKGTRPYHRNKPETVPKMG